MYEVNNSNIFLDVQRDLSWIDFEFSQIILAPFRSNYSDQNYLNAISVLRTRIINFNTKRWKILNDPLLYRDEVRVKEWISIINDSIEATCFTFSKGTLKQEIISNEQQVWWNYTILVHKILDKEKLVSLEEWGLYYFYNLKKLKNFILQRVRKIYETNVSAAYPSPTQLSAASKDADLDYISLQKNVSEIFKDDWFNVLDPLSIACEVMDENDRCLLSKRKAYLLYGMVDAIKKYQNDILKRNYTDQELLDYFNDYFGQHYKKLKRNSAGYALTFNKGTAFIKSRLNKG